MQILNADKLLFALFADVDNFEIRFGFVYNFPAMHTACRFYTGLKRNCPKRETVQSVFMFQATFCVFQPQVV